MGTSKRIDDKKLMRLVIEQGLSMSEAARQLKVSKQAVSQRLKRWREKSTVAVASKSGVAVVEKGLRVWEQLKKCNDEANRLLDELEDNPALKIKCLGEIRAQLAFQVTIFDSLFSAKAAATFQEAVLEVLEQAEPQLRSKVIERLNQQQTLRQSVTWA